MISKIVSIPLLILLSLTVLMPSACRHWVDHPNLVQHPFDLGDQSFIISLPSEFQRNPDVPFVQFLRPDYRVVRSLRFTDRLPTLDESPQKTPLKQGGELQYDIVTHGGGSGGIEAELVGHIILNQTNIGVTATDQDEVSPNPAWCIEFLHTLQTK